MKFTIVGSDHPICQELTEETKRDPILPVEAFRTLRRWGMGPAEQAIVATEKGRIVAFFRFEAEDKSHTTLYAYGTWVSKDYRGRKLAFKMWQKVLHYAFPDTVVVTAISRGGAGLVKSLRNRFRGVKWKFQDYSV